MKKRGIQAGKKSIPETGDISRKEAMKKAGKYAAFTAASMLFLFNPLDAQYDSEWPDDPGWDW